MDPKGNADAGIKIGVDVGGTFTDLIALDSRTGVFTIAKVPTTTGDQSVGFLQGLEQLKIAFAAVDSLVHGTTVGTNAVLERKGAICGLITTRGFRDVLELGRRTRPQLYGMVGTFEPIIPRDLRMEVAERINANGDILVPLDENEVAEAARQLLKRGATSVVIHFLHSYINSSHEERSRDIVLRHWPNKYVTISADVLREVREFERGTAAALNGYIQPVVATYIDRLSDKLSTNGFAKDLLIMQGNGGMMGASVTAEHAVHTLLSGPAAGVIASAETARQAGFRNIISCDMGGTSFDVAVIRNSEPTIAAEMDIDYAVPIRVPMIDIHTIGAGGGSIARINRAGILQVGPESAGAFPGSICYGRGGTQPTVTDANLVLGRINARAIAGVTGDVDITGVRNAIDETVGRPLGLSTEQAAAAIITVANNQMAGAIRLISIEKGYDPRDFALFPLGGAGPLHIDALARELGVPKVLVPRLPGITSALGCIIADVRHDFIQHLNKPLDGLKTDEIDAIAAQHIARGRELIRKEGIVVDSIDILHEVDVLYEGQTHLFRLPVKSPGFDAAEVQRDFAILYKARFDIDLPDIRVVLSNLRTAVFGRRTKPDLKFLAFKAADQAPATRKVYFDGTWRDAKIYHRDSLAADTKIAGPAIVEQMDTTLVIEPASRAHVDRLGNIIVEMS